MTEEVEHPNHYQLPSSSKYPNGVECLDVINALGMSFSLGNALKYIWRAGRKRGSSDDLFTDALNDLKKARFCLDEEIRRLEG